MYVVMIDNLRHLASTIEQVNKLLKDNPKALVYKVTSDGLQRIFEHTL